MQEPRRESVALCVSRSSKRSGISDARPRSARSGSLSASDSRVAKRANGRSASEEPEEFLYSCDAAIFRPTPNIWHFSPNAVAAVCCVSASRRSIRLRDFATTPYHSRTLPLTVLGIAKCPKPAAVRPQLTLHDTEATDPADHTARLSLEVVKAKDGRAASYANQGRKSNLFLGKMNQHEIKRDGTRFPPRLTRGPSPEGAPSRCTPQSSILSWEAVFSGGYAEGVGADMIHVKWADTRRRAAEDRPRWAVLKREGVRISWQS